jgi:hypothetical protein
MLVTKVVDTHGEGREAVNLTVLILLMFSG